MTDYSQRFKSLATNVVHAGAPHPRVEGAVVSPIFQSANFLMAEEAAYDEVRYLRLSNSPTHLTLQTRLATIESGEAALVTASGMAAISSTVLSLVAKGDHLLAQKTLYGGTQSLFDEDLPRFGISHSAIDLAAPETWAAALRPETRLMYVESISNPLMEVGDLRAAVEFAQAHHLVTVIDSTFATPVNFRPIEIGIDVVVHSATKYLNGHSDIVAGAVIGSAERVGKIRHWMLHAGGSADPHACFLFERGLKTLVLRVERQNKNAQKLAEFLAARPEVRAVNYPGLADDPGHGYAKSLFSGFGGMLSFYAADAAAAERFLGRVRIPIHAASLGGPETLVVRPARSSHLGQSPEERERLRITDDLVRVSVGIEEIDELIADFGQALGS
ncbi:MAG: PLP-dependent aspartate aminotransferase family protein [Acidobacteriota bacterium]|nr:PLP-dependent aspartate aminotransferase family protein [Acidobacteriota bacterium]